MLNTQKLLYILPDLAYIAELLPAKKEHEFSIQSFRQINGEFLDENEFVSKNLAKLVEKIESDEYHLILPDFLFTNTIVEVNESSDHKIQQYVKEKLLPSLGISKDSHDIETSLLTEYNGKSKIQFSALEKSLLNDFRLATHKKDIKITDVSPLSWTLKAIISLEPSISVVQIGSRLYLAQHYIGVDQTVSFDVEEVENIAETIKTLKGAEASIQTVYLITNQLVEEQLKEHLSDTLPLQQLAAYSEEESELPSYVKKIIETGLKTLSIADFPVPKFPLGKVTKADLTATDETPEKAESTAEIPQPNKGIFQEEDESPSAVTEAETETAEADLSDAFTPVTPAVVPAAEIMMKETTTEITAIVPEAMEETVDKEEAEEEVSPSVESEKPTIEVIDPDQPPKTPTIAMTKVETQPSDEIAEVGETAEKPAESSKENDTIDDIDLSLFAHSQTQPETVSRVTSNQTPAPKKIIKNSNDAGHMLKMIFITIATLFITVAIGVGIGIGFLYLSNQSDTPVDQTPVVSSPEPTTNPSPSPSPSPEAEINKSEISVLVVNATTTAGKAGQYKTMLTEDGFEEVTAANAKGEYEPGSYVLMTTQNTALITELENATDLDLTFSDEKAVEDAADKYDAVIVLNE